MSLTAEKYQNVREGVEYVIGGKVLEYEAKTILNDGIQIGLDRGRDEERNKALTEKEKTGQGYAT